MNSPSFVRARGRLEMLDGNHSELMGGVCVFAVKQKNVEAGRNGHCGQQAQHFRIVGLRDLRSAHQAA